MLLKSDHPLNPPGPTIAPACVHCGKEERRFLHHVRHRGIFRRLCTTCVLRLHPQSFCPTCFQVYPPTPSNDSILACHKCYSSSHSHCVQSPVTAPYICPLCTNPSGPIFELKSANVVLGGEGGEGEGCRVMDRDAAKKLLAAAKIAALSMNKAAVVAKAEAERRAKEAAVARKRAKEALEHVAYLVVKGKLSKKDGVSDVSGARGVTQVKIEKNVNVVYTGNGNGIVGRNVGASVGLEAKGRVENNSNHVLAALNAVELRENGKTSGGTTGMELGVLADDDCISMMDVEENGGVRKTSSGENDGGDIDPVGFTDLESGVEDFNDQDIEKDGFYAEPVTDQMQYKENGIGEEQHENGGIL